MPLLLKPVPPNRGARWLTDGFRLYARRPLAFTLMFTAFLFAALVVSLVPLLGGVLQMMSLPLLSLGFMVAAQSALLDGPVSARQFIEPLRTDPARRRALLTLCALYGVLAIAILILCDAISDGALERVQRLMASGSATPEDVNAVLMEPGVTNAALAALVLGTLLSIPFWHAPALVHWGAQGVAQALFSSTLAVWRSKGAFFVYGMAWAATMVGFGMAAALVFGLLGLAPLGTMLALPAGLLFWTVFYVSLLFTFNDSFGDAGRRGANA
ncbi:BPSS1780 family membrane protein [Rubrivivax sp. RP6-9]|uniref:BPSS1780 family membrane protein n=1 Tax=Rubrivivax sp. RP6-9 TaxID=3415750 RepID=UPI003CC5DB5B